MFKTNFNETRLLIHSEDVNLLGEIGATCKRLLGNVIQEEFHGIAVNGNHCQTVKATIFTSVCDNTEKRISGREALRNFALRIKTIHNLTNVVYIEHKIVEIL